MSIETEKILFVSTDRLGDLIWTLPALTHVRNCRKNARIFFLASKYAGDILESNPMVDRIFKLERDSNSIIEHLQFRIFLSRLGRLSPDVILIFKKGYIGKTIHRRFSKKAKVFSTFDFNGKEWDQVHRVRLRLALAEKLCGPFKGDPWPKLYVSKDFIERTRSIMRGMDLREKDYFILHPGVNRLIRRHSGIFPPRKRFTPRLWPMAHWKELARILARNGYVFLVSGTGRELPACVEIASEGGKFGRTLEKNIHPLELAGLCLFSRGIVVCDTGPAHVGAAVGAPVVALFGPSNPRITGPYGPPEKIRIITAGIHCSPCRGVMEEKCTDNICMKSISPGKVMEALDEVKA